MKEPSEPCTALIEDEPTTTGAQASSEPDTIVLDGPISRSTSRRAAFQLDRIGFRIRRVALVAGMGVFGLLVGFFGAWLLRERAASGELREALEIAKKHDSGPNTSSMARPDPASRPGKGNGETPSIPPSVAVRGAVSLAAATDLLMQNRHAEALAAYRQLSALHADEPVFADVVSILEVKLRCWEPDRETGPCD